MTYVFDPTKQTGTFYGIFARQGWSSSNCMGTEYTQNTSSRGTSPTAITRPCRPAWTSKPERDGGWQHLRCDTECGLRRHLAEGGPLYALSFADPKKLTVLSAVNGLSGNMDVFAVGDNNTFLMGIGQDTSSTCTGFQDPNGPSRQHRGQHHRCSRFDQHSLVQRQCVAVQNAEWVGSTSPGT